ncbi:MAG: hypothetical protein RL417_1861 [Pseudomonadota bacterium]
MYDHISLAAFLTQHGIPFELHDHPAVFTVAEADRVTAHLRGAPTKNLFLRDDKGSRHFLLAVSHTKRIELTVLAESVGVRKLSFASPDRLKRYLGVDPGAVTLLGVINDPTHAVGVLIDRDLWNAEELQCHPLANTATYIVTRESLERFFALTGHRVTIIDIPHTMSV